MIRQATQEQGQDCEGDGEGEGGDEGQEEVGKCVKGHLFPAAGFFLGRGGWQRLLVCTYDTCRIVWRVGDSRASTSYSSDDHCMLSLIDGKREFINLSRVLTFS